MAGVFITFEGIDGCGKSTQLRLFAAELRTRQLEVLTTREPGGTTLGQRLRAALLDVEEQVDPLAELLVFAADRAQHVRTVLRRWPLTRSFCLIATPTRPWHIRVRGEGSVLN